LSRSSCEENNCNYWNKLNSKERETIGQIIFNSEQIDWRQEQIKDSTISKIFLEKEKNQYPNWQEIVSEDNFVKIYWTQWDSFVIKNDILYRKWETPNLKSYIRQVIVPRRRIKQILEEAHDFSSGGYFDGH